MRIGLIAPAPRLAMVRELEERLAHVLPRHVPCLVQAFDVPRPAAFPLWIVLVDGGDLKAASEACLRIRAEAPDCFTLAAGTGTVHAGLARLLEDGADDILYLPVSDDELSARVGRALRRCGTLSASPGAVPDVDPRLQHVIARGPALRRVLAQLPTVAACSASVLVQGETGTGKEVVAQAVHYLSGRSGKPWVPVNCGAIPVDLLESELFGHVRGAYTTASTGRAGLVEEAAGGTLFLDDVDCLPLAAQTKLLRLLQEHEYRPVGSNRLCHADIRVIAASNRDLAAAAEHGSFRQDLYYRLDVVSLRLPPLRERREDIEPLARHFVERYAREFGRSVPALARGAVHKLVLHRWPGNVRELQHAIQRAVLLAPGPMLQASDLQLDGPCEPAQDASFQAAKARMISSFEREFIADVLARCGGNIARAAREAGKHRRAFFELMRKHGIKVDAIRDDLQ